MERSILLTGASGYVGGRLLRSLEGGGHAVRCLARQPARVAPTRPTTEVVAGDCLDEASLDRALAGVKSAYYLVHSMAAGAHFADLDRQAAENSAARPRAPACSASSILAGCPTTPDSLSAHLRSRAETGDALRAGGVPVIEFRASVVIGAGSLSFQMIQALVERLPVMVCPRWVATLTQPIAIDDVLDVFGGGAGAAGHAEQSLRDRRAGGGVLRRHDAGICAASRAATSVAARAGADAASVRPVARAGHAGAGACRSRARRWTEESDRRPVDRRPDGVRDTTHDASCFVPESDRDGARYAHEDRHPGRNGRRVARARRSNPCGASAAQPGGISATFSGGHGAGWISSSEGSGCTAGGATRTVVRWET